MNVNIYLRKMSDMMSWMRCYPKMC